MAIRPAPAAPVAAVNHAQLASDAVAAYEKNLNNEIKFIEENYTNPSFSRCLAERIMGRPKAQDKELATTLANFDAHRSSLLQAAKQGIGNLNARNVDHINLKKALDERLTTASTKTVEKIKTLRAKILPQVAKSALDLVQENTEAVARSDRAVLQTIGSLNNDLNVLLQSQADAVARNQREAAVKIQHLQRQLQALHQGVRDQTQETTGNLRNMTTATATSLSISASSTQTPSQPKPSPASPPTLFGSLKHIAVHHGKNIVLGAAAFNTVAGVSKAVGSTSWVAALASDAAALTAGTMGVIAKVGQAAASVGSFTLQRAFGANLIASGMNTVATGVAKVAGFVFDGGTVQSVASTALITSTAAKKAYAKGYQKTGHAIVGTGLAASTVQIATQSSIGAKVITEAAKAACAYLPSAGQAVALAAAYPVASTVVGGVIVATVLHKTGTLKGAADAVLSNNSLLTVPAAAVAVGAGLSASPALAGAGLAFLLFKTGNIARKVVDHYSAPKPQIAQ